METMSYHSSVDATHAPIDITRCPKFIGATIVNMVSLPPNPYPATVSTWLEVIEQETGLIGLDPRLREVLFPPVAGMTRATSTSTP